MEKKLPAEEIIEVAAPRRLPKHANCGNCFYGIVETTPGQAVNLSERTCIEGPPGVMAIPGPPQKNLAGQIITPIQFITRYPTMNVRQACHHWAPQDKDANIIGAIPESQGTA